MEGSIPQAEQKWSRNVLGLIHISTCSGTAPDARFTLLYKGRKSHASDILIHYSCSFILSLHFLFNMYFSNFLLLGTAALAVAAPSRKQKRVNNFQWFGVNESGAEFGNTQIPGTLGTQYIWPVTYVVWRYVGSFMLTMTTKTVPLSIPSPMMALIFSEFHS